MEKIGSIIKEVLKNENLQEPFVRASLKEKWEEIAGNLMASHLRVVSYKNKRLVLVAEDPGWSHQAELMKEDLKEKINNFYETPVVKNIRIKN
ncbi:MAG: DUF721 domain-containing protein [bacterium]